MKKTIKRILASLMVAVIVLTAAPLSGFVGLELPDLGEIFSTKAEAVTFSDGDGTEANPYQVENPEQLNAVRNNLLAHYIQTADIDMSEWGDWEPIGTDKTPFMGSYDGQSCTISNLKFSRVSSDGYIGLFGNIRDNATISNINVKDLEVNISLPEDFRYAYGGGIVARASDGSATSKKIFIDNCSVQGNINIKGIIDCSFGSLCNVYVGGITGSGNSINCVSKVNINVDTCCSIAVGGISAYGGYIDSCKNYGNIKVSNDVVTTTWDNIFCGGICSDNTYNTITHCINYGNIEVIGKNEVIVGGICGASSNSAKIDYCINYGNITAASSSHKSSGSGTFIGGIVANDTSYYNAGISNSINCGNLLASAKKQLFCGGVVACNPSGKISNCYNVSDNITCILEDDRSPNVGRISGSGGIISECYSINTTNVVGSSEFDVCKDGISISNTDIQNKIFPILLKFSLIAEYGVNIPEDIVFIDKDEHYLFSAYDKNGNDITDKVNWSSTTSVDCTGEVKITNNGDVQGVKEGLTDVHVTNRPSDDLNELCFDSCYVFVGDPNELKYTSVSDSIYYYGENAFYSDAGQFSDSVDIYIALENAIHEQIEFLTEYDEYADEFEKLAINGYTLYASVSGSNLSFDKDEYINNYISAFDGNIPIDKAVDELLTLYPYNLDVSSADKSFTVTIKIESEDFETITDSFTFKISSLEDKETNEHISFINSNGMYKAMRDEDFATGMSDLKNDSQYIWSKYSTLDFENYHEILMADILVQLMETQLVGNISLLPVLKEWKNNYDTILGSISTMVEDSYAGSMEITDNLLDKVIKKSKYTTDGMDVHDEVRDLVVLKLRDKVSIDKINKAFAAVDKTGQCLDLFDMGVNIANDIADWVDCVSIMNSYQNMNEEFKNVIQKVYDCIPNDDWKVKEAVNHYVKLDTTAGYTQEVIESVIELSKDITLEVFNSVFKKQFVSMFTKAVGSITLKSGALLSSTTAFSAISTGLGAISTGATLGLCISDILCNNSGQAEEMGKVVAASQLAPYVIQTLKYYEWALKNYKDESSLKHFEVAFNLNKALQIYSIEHTYKGLEIQANSIIIKLFSRRDYPGAMAELASLKTSHINCNCCEDVYTGVIKTKTIAIKCPVDVYIYDENGKEVVRIINDVAVYVENGINVFINGREKYVTVPADQEYSVKIVATDEGTMDYLVIEHDENGQYDRIVKSLNIDLNKNQTFTGKVCEEFDVNKDSYALNTNGNVIKPSASIDASNEIGGICGDNLTWAFDKSTGELVISGTGDMYENGDEWNEYRDSIVAVRIENGVTSIIDYAFSGYANLVDIVIPDSVTKVGRQICRDTPFYENQANWENGSLYIGNHLIETKYDYVGICTIKDGTKTIASSAFYDCYDLTGVIIPESVIGIGDTAFYSCYRLEQVSIPKNVLKIGDDAFGYCDVLQYINVDVHNPYYCSVDGVLYNKNQTELICYPMGKSEESFVVPNGVNVIEKSAFELCKLKSIIIADSVTVIESGAFANCENLKSIVLSKNISKIEECAFIYSSAITDIYYNNTKDAWNKIEISYLNDPLFNATIHFAGKVHSISIDDISMSYKDSATILPAIYADSGVKYTVSYSSSDDSVVSVDQNGKITTRDTGSATITVTVTDEYGNTVSDSCNVEVKYTWWQWIIVIVLFGWIWY